MRSGQLQSQNAHHSTVTQLSRAHEHPTAHLILNAIDIARYKSSSSHNDNGLTYGVGVEIERLCRIYHTPVSITFHTGTVSPADDLCDLIEDAPLVQSEDINTPPWARESAEHTWINVDFTGSNHTYHVDPVPPRQVTGSDSRSPVIEPGSSPPQYTSTSKQSIEQISRSRTLPWDTTATNWPYGVPSHVDPIPTDGGSNLEVTTNTVTTISAQDGLQQLPTESIDCIITSPPYRLQRAYPEAETIWDADSACDHTWETTILNTETPIREDGGAGLHSEGTAEELRNERNRTSTRCKHCNAWKGQLGHEETLDEFIDHLMTIFNECQRVLTADGSLYVNIADSYDTKQTIVNENQQNTPLYDAPNKSLIGLPERFMLRMIDEGWIAREHFIWTKPNTAPDPAPDRAGKAYEHVFRFVKQTDYHDTGNGPSTNVLEIPTADGTSDAVAPMPLKLPEQLLKSINTPNQERTILDPFAGTGTVLEAAAKTDNDYIGFEISETTATRARNNLQKYHRNQQSLSGQSTLHVFQ